ncbi:PPOX class F420-dependent oxidoreductase [Nocardia sp. BMG51109]|uniref:PPOX class F420-dependent oxidoreductase n=1 Tax=Nocardia sp. BMG51109 TaxID=1056816 RepID=UPI0004673813|nr:PPOX class F420-dependent oxidoreductase [Nocardia sp. BMG51109]
MAFRDDPDGDRFFALRTHRADGSAVSVPVWLAPANGRWYGYTPVRSWKVRRIRRDPRVAVAPSTFDGDPRGPWRSGTARVLRGRELRAAKRALTAKYGNEFRVFVLVTLLGRLRPHGGKAAGLEITLAAEDGDHPAG